MASLEEAAKKFKASKFTDVGQKEETDTPDDLDAQIKRRLRESVAQADPAGQANSIASPHGSTVVAEEHTSAPASEHESIAVIDETNIEPNHNDVITASGGEPDPSTWEIPQPVTRALGPRIRVAIEIPIGLEPLRLEAKAIGMASGHLVLAAMHAHQEQLLTQATNGQHQTSTPRGFTKQWQLMWHANERDEFDQLVDQTAEHMPRRSRAHVAALLLEHCRGTER